MMILSHSIALSPTCKQANALARAAGVHRFTHNWALAEWNRQKASGEEPTANKIKKQFNAIKREQFPWIYESPKDANQQPFDDLDTAFQNFFESMNGTRKGPRIGRPQFHKKGRNDSFYVSNDRFAFCSGGKRVHLPVIGNVKICEPFRFQGKIRSGRVKRVADRWFLVVQVKVEMRRPVVKLRSIVGMDLGLKTAIEPSQGEPFQAPKPLRAALRQLGRANRRLHRRKKGSKNRSKAQEVCAKIHARAANIRKDFWHKTTTDLCRENQTVVIEDLSMGFMLKNRRLSRAAADVGLGMFRPMLRYKAEIFGTEIIVAHRKFPSTQRCSGCGNIKTGEDRLGLGVSVYHCYVCGLIIGRDRNAALNLEQYPRLEGNWIRKDRTPTDDRASTDSMTCRNSKLIEEVGTKECPHVATF